jgi:7-cyano-7-deazaguanine synthase in queuosine biosynthesis
MYSGRQDSTTCLAWALERFDVVETVAFDHRQRLASNSISVSSSWRTCVGAFLNGRRNSATTA